jgi:hypothetical protein
MALSHAPVKRPWDTRVACCRTNQGSHTDHPEPTSSLPTHSRAAPQPTEHTTHPSRPSPAAPAARGSCGQAWSPAGPPAWRLGCGATKPPQPAAPAAAVAAAGTPAVEAASQPRRRQCLVPHLQPPHLQGPRARGLAEGLQGRPGARPAIQQPQRLGRPGHPLHLGRVANQTGLPVQRAAAAAAAGGQVGRCPSCHLPPPLPGAARVRGLRWRLMPRAAG